MIDLDTEQVISLGEAAERLPRRGRGRKPHLATLYRWSNHGVRGVRLETIQIGGTRCTSVEALQRFVETLSSQNSPGQAGPPRRPPESLHHTVTTALDNAGL